MTLEIGASIEGNAEILRQFANIIRSYGTCPPAALELLANRFVSIHQEKCNALQAKIDALMIEHCPDEMAPEQVETWGAAQRVVEESRT